MDNRETEPGIYFAPSDATLELEEGLTETELKNIFKEVDRLTQLNIESASESDINSARTHRDILLRIAGLEKDKKSARLGDTVIAEWEEKAAILTTKFKL